MLFSEVVVYVLIYSYEVSILNFDVVFSYLNNFNFNLRSI